MTRLFLSLFLILFLIPATSRADTQQSIHADGDSSEYSLYVSECAASPCGIYDIVRYRFVGGVLQPKMVLGRFSTDKIRFDIGKARIVDNRYLVPGLGKSVIDTKDGKLLLQIDLDEKVKKEIHDTRPSSESKDFALHSYSPDRTKVAYSERDKVYTLAEDKKKSVLATGLSVELSKRSADLFGDPPILWLDNTRILTQQKNGKIILVRDTDKTPQPELIADIPISEPALSTPSLDLAPDGTVYYYISLEKSFGKHFKIDVDRKNYTPMQYMPVGSDFSIQLETKMQDRELRYRDKSIGAYWCSFWDAKTIAGYLAVLYGPTGSNLGYPEGVTVWSRDTEKWTEIKTNWGPHILGWIKD